MASFPTLITMIHLENATQDAQPAPCGR